MNKHLALSLLSLVLISSLVTGSSLSKDDTGREKPILKIGYLPITHSLDLVVADKQYSGKYRNFSLELVKLSSWTELSEALNSGHIDGASILIPLAMGAAENGVPLEILALSHRHGNVMIVSNDVSSIKDLKGKRVAIPHRLSVHTILLDKALKNSGLTLDDVQWIEMPPPDMPSALANGDIKGYVVAENFGAKAVLGGYGKLLFKSQDIWSDEICCGIVLSRDFVQKHPKAVAEFIDSLARSGEFIDGNRSDAIKIGKEYMNMDEAVWKQSFEWGINYSSLKPTRVELGAVEDYLVGLKLLKGSLNLDKFLDASFIAEAYQNGGD